MAKVFVALALGLLVALPAAQAEVAAGDRTITKVIKLLQGMLVKSKADGEKDTELFAKYKCYCDSNTASKTKAIAEAKKSISVLASEIAELQASSGGLSTENAGLQFAMGDNEAARQTATELRDKENADFTGQETDMKNAIGQMDQAIDTLSAIGADQTAFLADKATPKRMALLKLKSNVEGTIKAAAYFLPRKDRHALEAFIQAPFTGTYQAQSGEIVGILKNMRDTFKSNLASAQAAEKAQKEQYDSLTAVKTEEFENMASTYEDKKKAMGGNDDLLSSKVTVKAETETAQADDEDFLAKLTSMCAAKTKAFEDRKMVRAGEEAAVAQAVSILNSDSAFDTFGTTNAATTGFLQMRLRTHRKTARQLVTDQLKREAKRQRSLRLAKVAALLEGGNPFNKVCSAVEGMVAIIQKEQQADHDQLDWCNSEREENHKVRDEKQGNMDTLEEKKSGLVKTIEEDLKPSLAKEQESLALNQADQAANIEDRGKENAAYQKNVHNLQEAERILKRATKALTKFYDWLKAKEGPHHYDEKAGKDSGGANIRRISEASVDDLKEACSADPACVAFNTDGYLKSAVESEDKWYDQKGSLYVKVFDSFLLQQHLSKEDPAPPTEEFSEKGTESGNKAVEMLQKILGETEDEEKAAHESEEAAQKDFEDTMATLKSEEATTQDSIADLSESLAEKTKTLLQTEADLAKTTAEHKAVEKYLLKIKPGCDFITENIDLRDEHRGKEIDALRGAEETLKSTPVYKKAAAEAEKQALGECADRCPVGEDKNLACKACIAGITESAYCGGHADDPVCK